MEKNNENGGLQYTVYTYVLNSIFLLLNFIECLNSINKRFVVNFVKVVV